MSKGLEALEVIGFCPIDYDGKEYTRIRDEYAEEFEDVEKELKVLKIIKNKIGIHWKKILLLGLKNKLITQEEFDLLNEVLL